MTEHRCDPSPDPLNTPVSQLRALRILAATIKDPLGPPAEAANAAIARCAKCCHEVAHYTAELMITFIGDPNTAFIGDSRPDMLMYFELQIAQLEVTTGWGNTP